MTSYIALLFYTVLNSPHSSDTINELYESMVVGGTYLEVSDRSVEGVVAESALLVEELAGLAVDRRAEETIVEALL